MSDNEPLAPIELPEFDAAEFARRWKSVWPGDVVRLEQKGAHQKLIVDNAPESWLRALVREVPRATLWAFLNPKSKSDYNPLQLDARQTVLRGFQQTQSIMRHVTVQNRMVTWLDKHREVAHLLLLLWEEKNGEVVRAIDEEADEAALVYVMQKHGPLAVWLGSAYVGSERVFSEVESLLSHPEVWNTAEEIAAMPEQVEAPEVGEPGPDSQAAKFWHERAEKLQKEVELRTRELKLARDENAEMETLRERLRATQRELDKARKEEKSRETAWQKKLELAQKAAQTQLSELKKHDERETRRLHAAEKTRDELDSTVKVLRKQVRHLNQLLDEQQKKNAALEAQLAKIEAERIKAETPVVEPPPPKPAAKAPKQPAKPVRLSPLDEVFSWVADGHEFRVTARDAMRQIDKGDADFAFRAQLALEGIAPQDVAKKNAFLTRLREQDGYYVRVLTEPTQRALVDASNVVRSTKNRYGKGELRNLRGMQTELRRLGFFPIEIIADASLRHNVDEINAYNEMINKGLVEVVTPGMEADEVLVRKFRSGGGYVITNDTKFHFKVSPDLAPPSLSFRVSDGVVLVDDF